MDLSKLESALSTCNAIGILNDDILSNYVKAKHECKLKCLVYSLRVG